MVGNPDGLAPTHVGCPTTPRMRGSTLQDTKGLPIPSWRASRSIKGLARYASGQAPLSFSPMRASHQQAEDRAKGRQWLR